jgi:hypothetical protein
MLRIGMIIVMLLGASSVAFAKLKSDKPSKVVASGSTGQAKTIKRGG